MEQAFCIGLAFQVSKFIPNPTLWLEEFPKHAVSL